MQNDIATKRVRSFVTCKSLLLLSSMSVIANRYPVIDQSSEVLENVPWRELCIRVQYVRFNYLVLIDCQRELRSRQLIPNYSR